RRLERLRAFWEQVTARDSGWMGVWDGLLADGPMRGWLNQLSAGKIVAEGAPGFFTPRVPPPYLRSARSPGATSRNDVAPLKATLERLVDFDRITARQPRFSVGAVNVRTGNFAYFDNATHRIGPEHVMPSGALPPAFQPVEIEGELYWDGGLV